MLAKTASFLALFLEVWFVYITLVTRFVIFTEILAATMILTAGCGVTTVGALCRITSPAM